MEKQKKPRKKATKSGLPKGAYRHPEHGIIMPARTYGFVDGRGKQGSVKIQVAMHEQPNVKQLAKAFIALAEEQNRRLDS